MATGTVKAYDRAQNNYALGVVDANAANIQKLAIAAGATLQADVKIVPTDIFGRILKGAKVTFGTGTAATVEDGGNITTVALFSDVKYKVEAEGYATVEGTISAIRGNVLIHSTLVKAAASAAPAEPVDSETPGTPGGVVDNEEDKKDSSSPTE